MIMKFIQLCNAAIKFVLMEFIYVESFDTVAQNLKCPYLGPMDINRDTLISRVLQGISI